MPVTISGTSGITTPGLTNSGSTSTAGLALSSGSISFVDSSTLPSATFSPVFPITASVSSNALTVTLNACALVFRSTTLGSGTTSTVTVSSPISVTVSSGSTLGTVNATQSRIVVLAINNAGTVELAVVNISGGNQLDETNLISTTAEGGAGAADSANVIYSTTARSSVAYRVVGYVESTQTTAGTWATAPSTIQGYGGQALSAMSSIGYGQTWQAVTRTSGTTYYNTTGKPLMMKVQVSANSFANAALVINGLSLGAIAQGYSGSGSTDYSGTAIIPVGASYSITLTAGTLVSVFELR